MPSISQHSPDPLRPRYPRSCWGWRLGSQPSLREPPPLRPSAFKAQVPGPPTPGGGGGFAPFQEHPLPSGVSSAQPTLRPAVALTVPKRDQGGPVPTPSCPGHPMNAALLPPQMRGPDARVSSCGDEESWGLLLEAGPGPEGGKQGTKHKGHKCKEAPRKPNHQDDNYFCAIFFKIKIKAKVHDE